MNSAWTPLYIAGGTGQRPELIYQWHPWLFGQYPDNLAWWQVPPAYYPSVVGVEMAVWQTPPPETIAALEPRVPAMMDRAWAPGHARTYADFQARVAHTQEVLQALYPPAPPAPTPAPGDILTPQPGACRDARGGDGTRLEWNNAPGSVNLTAACQRECLRLGLRCDAFDVNADGRWCSVWGNTLSTADALSPFVFADGGAGTRVCHGDMAVGPKNICYARPPLC